MGSVGESIDTIPEYSPCHSDLDEVSQSDVYTQQEDELDVDFQTTAMPMFDRSFVLDRKGRISVSLWVLLALGVLLLSNILFFVAFLTNGWGVLNVHFEGAEPDIWDFGLWQCCRHRDGLCLGPRWPDFYGASRAFSVLGMFGHVLSFGWLMGYALEKLLDYDPCTLGSLAALNFSTAIFILISVSCFGGKWPVDFAREFGGVSTETQLSYSFGLACTTVFLMLLAGALAIVEIKITWRAVTKHPFVEKHLVSYDPSSNKDRQAFLDEVDDDMASYDVTFDDQSYNTIEAPPQEAPPTPLYNIA